MVEQQLHSSHHLLSDGVQKGVADIDAEAQQEFDDLQILVLDADEQGRAAEGVDAVDVDLEVNLRLLRKQLQLGVGVWNADLDQANGKLSRSGAEVWQGMFSTSILPEIHFQSQRGVKLF